MAGLDYMVDLETLDTSPTSVLLSVGIVKFDLPNKTIIEQFEIYPSIEDQLKAGRTVSESTLLWWMGQSEEARTAMRCSKRVGASLCAERVSLFVRGVRTIWSNGGDFDIPMLVSFLTTFNQSAAWPFWNNRCFRTFMALRKTRKTPAAHTALEDAVIQVKDLFANW